MGLNLIFIVGEAATGKTTLAHKVAQEFKLPLLSKDTLKVILLDALGWKDRQWSRKIGKASYDLMDYIIEEHLKAGNSLVIESTFNPKFGNPKFQAWQNVYKFNSVQVYCYADAEVIIERFKERALADSRHVSYVEGKEGLADLQQRLAAKQADILDVKGEVIRVDTTDFSLIDDKAVLAQVRRALV